MKSVFSERRTSALLAILFLVLPFAITSAQTQQKKPRARVTAQPQRSTTTATTTTASKPKQTPVPRTSPTPKPSSTPNITPTPSVPPAAPVVRPQQTVSELQANIRRTLQNPALARGQVGVKIVSLDTGKTIFEENAEKYFMPASNMKSFVMAAALDRLTPDFRFVTSVYAASKPDQSGTIRGDVIVYGRGDPSIAASFNNGDYYAGINALAEKIAASGVKRVEGNLIGDESYFSGDALGATWEWDDLQWYYGAEISALTVNDNAVDLKIAPGVVAGSPCLISVSPANSLFSIINLTSTAPTGTKREIEVVKRLGANVLEIRGSMPIGDNEYKGSVAVSNPAEMFVGLLKNAVASKGVVVTGQIRAVNAKTRLSAPLNLNSLSEIARLESAPLSLIAAKTLKPSQNLYTELTLRALGETVGDKTDLKKTSAERGLEVVQKFLAEVGIAPTSIVQWDGSGLSRHNLITPNAATTLYVYMSKHRYAPVWTAAQTVAGIDGTLEKRFKNTSAENNVRGKTGTIDQVATLSGYVTTAGGERLAFSILTNNLPDASLRRSTIDEIIVQLASFNGKSE